MSDKIKVVLVGGALDGSDLTLSSDPPLIELEIYTADDGRSDTLIASGRTVLYLRRGEGADGLTRYDHVPWGSVVKQ